MNSNKIGKHLREARLKNKLRQADVAEKIGVHVNYYARIERDEANPALETLREIMKVLKIKSLEISN